MCENIKLSVIMPCYNMGDTLDRAIESIVMQKTDFNYEIIIVDDKSTDNTLSIARKWATKHFNIRIVEHSDNQGNAMAFYDGLSAANGDYFCVLDGDDYYTVPDKFQKQVDFLDGDVNQEYVGVAHYFLIDLGNGKISIPKFSDKNEFNYIDLLTQNSGYYHTATYIYRNIFRGNVPDLYKENIFRGDTPRTTFHLMYSNKKIKILRFFGSAYCFTFSGIWSSLTQKQQFSRQIRYLNAWKEKVHSTFEVNAIDRMVMFNQNKLESATDSQRRYPEISFDEALENIQKETRKFAFAQREYIFQGTYFSERIDSLCASIGCVYRQQNVLSETNKINENNICIVIGKLTVHGGGIFREIIELSTLYPDKSIYILVTNMEVIPAEVLQVVADFKNITIQLPDSHEGRLAGIYKAYNDIAPAKTYYYTSHDDPFGMALIQPNVGKNICLFSFDHGFICGIANPYLDTIIAKRATDYKLLQKRFGKFKDKIIYIPTWNIPDTIGKRSYRPFSGHDKLITASGAARFYKLDGGTSSNSYINMILELLKRTRGKHYHFGPIPEDRLEFIRESLTENGLASDAFVNIVWADNLAQAMLDAHIDIFIEPFPVVSYKMTLNMFSAGIPVFAYNGSTRISKMDFIYPDCLLWNSPTDFFFQLEHIDAFTLLEHSKKGKEYFNSTHSITALKQYVITETPFMMPSNVYFVDDILQDIAEYSNLFTNCGYLKGKSTKTEYISDRDILTLEKVYASPSYKVGYFVMWLPRTLKALNNKVKTHGVKEAIHLLCTTDYLSMDAGDERSTLETVLSSRTYKIGHALLTPLRKIKWSTKQNFLKFKGGVNSRKRFQSSTSWYLKTIEHKTRILMDLQENLLNQQQIIIEQSQRIENLQNQILQNHSDSTLEKKI